MAQEYSCRIYDRNGELIQVTPVSGGGRREFTPIKKIPKAVQKEFLRQEDRRFYFHHGVDWLSLSAAFFQNRRSGKIVRGASTITMQLAKLINKDNSPTLRRKIKDIFNAYRLEAKLSKKKILELYLNSIYFGSNSYGITSAARTFYGCELYQLSKEEILALSVVPRNPNYIVPADARYFRYPFNLPHFVNFLTNQFERSHQRLPYELHTTVDLEISQIAEGFLCDALEQAHGSRITNGALLLLDNSDGSVISWLGNGDFFDNENAGQIDGVLVRNQPGSSMKPFLYALAIEKDLIQPYSVLADVPSEFGSEKLYIPENFNNRFNGPVRMRIALASSLNVPAVSTLDRLGVKTYLEKLYELGFDSLRENDAGLKADLGLALGAGEVSLKELVPAFSVFVRNGNYFPLKYLAGGKTALKSADKTTARQLYSTDTARIIASILSDKGARALGFGYSQTFQTDYPSIFKTGTSNQYQNIIALGATKSYIIGVWMGNHAGNTVMGKTGSSLPAWVAKNTLDKIENRNYSLQGFPEPEGWHKERICSLSGLKAGENCKAVVSEYVKDGCKLESCSWHVRKAGSEEVQVIYPPEYQQWLRSRPDKGLIEYSQSPLTIITPKDEALFFYSSFNSQLQAIPFEVTGGAENTLTVYYDEEKFAEVNRPFIFSLPVERGEHSCRLLCGSEEVTLNFRVK
ncbi:transglycosylase domain-containing protein [Treponema sp. C6A8]|uniref:transglycosylase domain-containing protein n=1 Tax=Treponema sp. C6A8 TaxID=1410609 RepID=UPI0018CC600A|nr:transglycosylase domain-containing protein [Treponema sp. C6A8]